MSVEQVTDLILLVLGLVIIVATILAGHKIPAGKFDVKTEKLGFSVAVDAVPLLLLIGFTLTCTGSVFRYLARDDLQAKLAQEQTKREALEGLHGERLRARLTFPGLDFKPDKITKLWAEDESGNQYPVLWKKTADEPNSVETEPPVYGLRLGSSVRFNASVGDDTYTGEVKGQVARAIVEMKHIELR